MDTEEVFRIYFGQSVTIWSRPCVNLQTFEALLQLNQNHWQSSRACQYVSSCSKVVKIFIANSKQTRNERNVHHPIKLYTRSYSWLNILSQWLKSHDWKLVTTGLVNNESLSIRLLPVDWIWLVHRITWCLALDRGRALILVYALVGDPINNVHFAHSMFLLNSMTIFYMFGKGIVKSDTSI